MKLVPFSKLKGDENPDEVIPVVLLSLEDQVKRRDILKDRGVPQEWIDSYLKCSDMRNIHISAVEKYIDDIIKLESLLGRKVRPTEIGCAISHKTATNWLAKSNFNMMIIFEDDIIPHFEDFEKRTIEVVKFLMPSAINKKNFICHLGAPSHQIVHALKRPVYSLQSIFCTELSMSKIFLHTDPDKTIWRAHAYIVSKSAALKAYELETKYVSLADDWCFRRKFGIIKKIFYCQPIIFKQDEENDSTIRPVNHNDGYKSNIEKYNFTIRLLKAIKHGEFFKRSYLSAMFRLSVLKARLASYIPIIIN